MLLAGVSSATLRPRRRNWAPSPRFGSTVAEGVSPLHRFLAVCFQPEPPPQRSVEALGGIQKLTVKERAPSLLTGGSNDVSRKRIANAERRSLIE